MSKNSFTILFIFSILSCGYSQNKSNVYIPESIDSIKNYLTRINKIQLSKIEGKHASKIRKIYEGRDKKVVEAIKDSVYYFSPEIQKNLDVILNTIYTSNPEINPKDYSFFINNSALANAGCYGDGMFEINLGLFDVLESDDELASIICHEIAHKLLEHSIKGASKRIATINSKDTKQKVRALKRKKYGRSRAALSVIDKLTIDVLDHSQEVEAEADSLGFVLYSKTKYSKQKATSALLKLKAKDDMHMSHNVNLDSVFNFETYPFKAFWLKEETSIFDTKTKINDFKLTSDTIKTHPEIEFRVNKLKTEFNMIDTVVAPASISQINAIKNTANRQSITYALDLNLLDLAIYQLIEKYDTKKINADFYYTTMATVFKKIYVAMKNHKLGKYVPYSNSFFEEKQLNAIRRFIHNLELKEIALIGEGFCDSNQNKLSDKKALIKINTFFKSILNK